MAKLPCPPELWQAFSSLLDQALDLPVGDRPHWLKALGEEHADVRPWLERVLTRSAGALNSDFMESLSVSEPVLSEFYADQRVGPYRLVKQLGSGGMGEVWLASRSDGTLNRQVALKLPHAHLLEGAIRRRFERERDILAALAHPHIAQLYDAGVADGQHPYLAMECVDGTSINDHCRNEKLSLEARLDLFLQVLDAVGYAHGRLIAHRDLKPSNILVTRESRVKLLDFGIAKLLGSETGDQSTQLTRVGGCIATPDYAAPEQLKGEPITVAVDLYALGVILHELLTGRRPFRGNRHVVVDSADSARASSSIDAEHAPTVAGSDARKLRRALSGDLDAIVAKSLEFDPARRYGSATAFALDIRRSRNHHPITARRISPATLLLKFVRRHQFGVSMAAATLLLLVGGSAAITWYAVRAEREAERATSIKDFLIGVFRASDPRIAADKPRGEITAKDLLDASALRIESSFVSQPSTQIELLGVTAEIYRELDETRRSTQLYARESELATRFYGAADAHAIEGLLGQAYNADADGDDERALQLLGRADWLIRGAHLDGTVIRARWHTMLGEVLMGDTTRQKEAQASLQAAAALFKSVAPHDPRYPGTLTDLGSEALTRSEFAAAAGYYRQAIAVAASSVQMEGDLLLAYAGLALALRNLGDFEDAGAAFDHGTRIAERTYGRESQSYWMIASDWDRMRYERGDRQSTLAAFEALMHELPRDEDRLRNAPEAAQVLRKFGRCLAIDGDGARSVELLEKARALMSPSASDGRYLAGQQADLGIAYEAGGRIEEARAAFLASLHTLQAQKAPAAQLARAHERLGRFFLAQRDPDAAEKEFNTALKLSAGHAVEPAVYARAGLATLAVARGDARTATEASLIALEQLDHIEGFYDVRVQPYVWGVRANSLALSGDLAGARSFAQRMLDAARLYFSPTSAAVTDAERLVDRLSRS
jgi:serine/threonine protein kinase/tetratricopeptide (TPR) repeat protein